MTPNARDTVNVPDDTKTEQDEHADGGGGGGGGNVGQEEEPTQEQARFWEESGEKHAPQVHAVRWFRGKTPVPVQC